MQNDKLSYDQQMMQRVLSLASQGITTTPPNPCVGCVIVNDGKVVGEGWHRTAGGPHAERLALEQAGELARGATVYVNLEPCCHQGRTPPCTDALINAGVSKVVIASVDPNPLVSGGGIELLRSAGIEVVLNVLRDESVWLNRGFICRMQHKKSWVTLKTAATLDGRTAAFDGESKWITGEVARNHVHKLRAGCSAVLTGIDTVLVDDPALNVRLDETTRQPFRVVLDSQLRLPIDAKVIGEDGQLIVFTLSQDIEKIAALTELGVEVITHTATESGQLALLLVIENLAKWQFNQILIEAGQTLSGAFLEQGLVDELVLFYAGSILGDNGKSMFKFNAPLSFADRAQYRINDVVKAGDDIKVTAVNQASVEALATAPTE